MKNAETALLFHPFAKDSECRLLLDDGLFCLLLWRWDSERNKCVREIS